MVEDPTTGGGTSIMASIIKATTSVGRALVDRASVDRVSEGMGSEGMGSEGWASAVVDGAVVEEVLGGTVVLGDMGTITVAMVGKVLVVRALEEEGGAPLCDPTMCVQTASLSMKQL